MINIKERLTCQSCNDIYKNPIMLVCCGESICKQHVEQLLSSNSSGKFMCPFCNEENQNQNLKTNKLIQSLIEIDLHKFKLDPKYEIVFDKLKMEIRNIETILSEPENYIFEEISELKRQVDLDRERLKSEIDELANTLIQQLESYENRFKTEVKTNVDLEYYNDLVESSKKQLVEYERCLSFFSVEKEKRKEEFNQSAKLIRKLQPNYIQIKNSLFSNLLLSYKPMEINPNDLFGKLEISVS